MTDAGAVGWPDAAANKWAAETFNRALLRDNEIDRAEDILGKAGLPLHPDRPKNWDTALALLAAANLSRDTAILDAGAEKYSSLLPALKRLGFHSLTGINLAFDAPSTTNGIDYRPGDVTSTGFSSSTFGFIACLSVIEHGVDVQAFLYEASRLLRNGGLLFLSTDYWRTNVPTHGRYAYGVPIRIFTEADLTEIERTAEGFGLQLVSDIDGTCEDHVVHWRQVGLRYTFVNMLFRKVAP